MAHDADRGRSRVHLTACALALVMLTGGLWLSAPAHASETRVYGGTGGQPNRTSCPQGAFLVGFNIRAGAWTDFLQLICGTWSASEQRIAGTTDGAFFGMSTGGVAQTLTCASDRSAIGTVRIGVTRNAPDKKFVQNLAFLCRTTNAPAASQGVWASFKYDNTPDGSSEEANINCPAGEVAIGINVHWGQFIDAIGLICAPPTQVIAAATPPPPPPPAAPAPPGKRLSRINSAPAGPPVDFSGEWNLSSAASGDSQGLVIRQNADGGATGSVVPENITILRGLVKGNRLTGKWGADGGYWIQMTLAADGSAFTAILAEGKTPGSLASPSFSFNGKRMSADAGTPATPTPPGPSTMSGSCGPPGGTAVVTIGDPSLTRLNVRASPGGKVLGTIPEGESVSIVGECGSTPAAGIAATLGKPSGGLGKSPGQVPIPGPSAPPSTGGTPGWCQIDAPVNGCVSAKFLAFVPTGGAAGIAKPQTLGKPSSTVAAGFAGSWDAEADGVAYQVTLTQKGSTVSGRYSGADGSAGTLAGQLKGGVLRFSWTQNDGQHGSGKFTLAGDGQSFTGSYSLGKNPDIVGGLWNGTRR